VVPNNISPVPLPPRAPELNGQDNIWQFMRQNRLSNRIFKSFDDIVDHCRYAWNTLIDHPWKIMSTAPRLGSRRSLNLRIDISTTLADFSQARDSRITFSVTHGWSAFWRGRPWLAGRRIGETSSDVGSSRF
jgi:hypothetical protein